MRLVVRLMGAYNEEMANLNEHERILLYTLKELPQHKAYKSHQILVRLLLRQALLSCQNTLEQTQSGYLEEEPFGLGLDGLSVEEVDDTFHLLGGGV